MSDKPFVVDPSSAEVDRSVPEWAKLQIALMNDLDRAALEFVERYCRADGTLRWRDSWPGMDGSDDPYEAFMHLPLLYALGGSDSLLTHAHRVWDAITWQWTEYGQIADEFDRYYDWMHHGEGYNYFYLLPLADPHSLKLRQRAHRFASMYTAASPLGNFNPETGLLTSPLTGSNGPRHTVTREDFVTHRGVLDNYAAPFEDLPGVDYFSGKVAWSDDEVYDAILERFNARMARGDVPMNLNSTTLLLHAYMLTGEVQFADWIRHYVGRWEALAAQNDGIIPDNVGLSGRIGEYNDGKWWGGYYGWRWPHGFHVMFGAISTGAANLALVNGNLAALDFARMQLDGYHERGVEIDGRRLVPNKRADSGWTDLRLEDPRLALSLWSVSLDEADARRVERVPRMADWGSVSVPTSGRTKHYFANSLAWFEYIRGRNPDFPIKALQANRELMSMKLERMRSPKGAPDRLSNPENFTDGLDLRHDGNAIHVWQELTPIHVESLVNLTMGANIHGSYGGLQHAAVRHFDAHRKRPGLPDGVAALVSEVRSDGVVLELVNTKDLPATVVTQAGAFGEHRFDGVRLPGGRSHAIAPTKWLAIDLPARSSVRVEASMVRFAASPTYESPWHSDARAPGLIRGRSE
ncbi:hypothetical protein FBY40_0187 [Microbacterium sp. SLBN-154]|uniref:hypothetical protein n=1 Tax=Microbacterium sp. SLBN-154 TaxID=2768458 RepID=UPI00114ECE99|nr:hypothetical protein [Microbacterium sp. SLBN-154]TQK17710.1 hypothetical protein FBY40_0187 [Microbacterium sp. SLBN-154]